MPSQTIPLFYWSEIKFIFKNKENYGDLLSKYLVEKISGKNTTWVHPKKQSRFKWNKTNYLAIGSIIHHASKYSIVWGSGIIDRNQAIENAKFNAVRGPQTRKYLLDLGYNCPEIYGDPALLLPKYYNPKVEKKYNLGLIPHYHDYNNVLEKYKSKKDVLVIDLMTMDIEEVTKKIMSCKKTISSSLHGVIVSHAFEIPSIWVEFSDKIFGDGIKYVDYLESIGLCVYKPKLLTGIESNEELETLIKDLPNLPDKVMIAQLQEKLMKVCPFV
jgi:pyruvyltransferase